MNLRLNMLWLIINLKGLPPHQQYSEQSRNSMRKNTLLGMLSAAPSPSVMQSLKFRVSKSPALVLRPVKPAPETFPM